MLWFPKIIVVQPNTPRLLFGLTRLKLYKYDICYFLIQFQKMKSRFKRYLISFSLYDQFKFIPCLIVDKLICLYGRHSVLDLDCYINVQGIANINLVYIYSYINYFSFQPLQIN